MRKLISRNFILTLILGMSLTAVLILDTAAHHRIDGVEVQVRTHTGEILTLQGETREVLMEVRQHTRHIQSAIERIEERLSTPHPVIQQLAQEHEQE